MTTQLQKCCECSATANWARYSRIVGNRAYCDRHAHTQPDFLQTTINCYWEELYSDETRANLKPKDHPVCVSKYAGTVKQLAEDVHRMRYDAVGMFYLHALEELHRQVDTDRRHGHPQLAALLQEAANDILDLRELFARIYDVCRKHMLGVL